MSDNNLPDDFLEDIFTEVEADSQGLGNKFLENIHLKNNDFRYDILDEIDYGGMKSIFRAIDKQTRRQVAIAFIRNEEYSDKVLRYFIQEAWLTASLQHPNIVPIYDIGVAPDRRPYFVMKLLSGENLASILAKLDHGVEGYSEGYDLNSLLNIFIKICDAVSYAHDSGVIHLDLKPENIQVSNFGQVLLIDWGIAFSKLTNKIAEEGEELESLSDLCQTIFGSIKGTPGYMAPEQMRRGNEPADERADIFGLGAILYSILTYERPGAEESKESVEVFDYDFTWPSEITIPEALKAIVTKAIEPLPKKRYQSAGELKDDLESFLAGRATEAEQASFIRLLVLLIKRNKAVVFAISLSVTFIIIMTVVFISRLSQSEKNGSCQ